MLEIFVDIIFPLVWEGRGISILTRTFWWFLGGGPQGNLRPCQGSTLPVPRTWLQVAVVSLMVSLGRGTVFLHPTSLLVQRPGSNLWQKLPEWPGNRKEGKLLGTWDLSANFPPSLILTFHFLWNRFFLIKNKQTNQRTNTSWEWFSPKE